MSNRPSVCTTAVDWRAPIFPAFCLTLMVSALFDGAVLYALAYLYMGWSDAYLNQY